MIVQRTEQFGATLIGPPTFAEYFSVGLEELLVSRGSQQRDQTQLILQPTDELPEIQIDDYYNDTHIGFNPDDDQNAEHKALRAKFYSSSGHIPVLSVKPLIERSPGWPNDTEVETDFFYVYRPKDIRSGGWLASLLLRGLTKKQLSGDQIIIANKNIQTGDNIIMQDPMSNPIIQRIVKEFEN